MHWERPPPFIASKVIRHRDELSDEAISPYPTDRDSLTSLAMTRVGHHPFPDTTAWSGNASSCRERDSGFT
jgi:hypothetical protein